MVFVISVLSVISANPAIEPLACGCLNCLVIFVIFVIPSKVPKGHKHRVTSPEKPWKIPRGPRRDPRRALGETPAEPSERPPQSPLRGKFPRRALRGLCPSDGALRNFRIPVVFVKSTESQNIGLAKPRFRTIGNSQGASFATGVCQKKIAKALRSSAVQLFTGDCETPGSELGTD